MNLSQGLTSRGIRRDVTEGEERITSDIRINIDYMIFETQLLENDDNLPGVRADMTVESELFSVVGRHFVRISRFIWR